MNKWLAQSDETKRLTYEQIAVKTGMSAFAVEKDWWVVQSLAAVFSTSAADALVFKGGTSLSKAWQLIERFSEDIDLAIDRSFFGYNGDLTKKQVSKLRKEAGAYAAGPFLQEMRERFAVQGLDPEMLSIVEAGSSDQDPRIIEVQYPNVIPAPGYLAPRVQIEISCRSLIEPFSQSIFGSLVDEHYADKDFANPFIAIPVVNPERTFLEKIFLLHEEFQKPADKIRVDRLSRHLYDIVKISRTNIANQALGDNALYSTIVAHRFAFNQVAGVNYQLHQPQSIDFVPKEAFLKAWGQDYNLMRERMIYEEDPPLYEDLITELIDLRKKINELEWTIEMPYLKEEPQE